MLFICRHQTRFRRRLFLSNLCVIIFEISEETQIFPCVSSQQLGICEERGFDFSNFWEWNRSILKNSAIYNSIYIPEYYKSTFCFLDQNLASGHSLGKLINFSNQGIFILIAEAIENTRK